MTKNDNERPGAMILDAYEGKTNIIEDKNIDDTMIKTFEFMLNLLSDYCGPYGKYAILAATPGSGLEPTFTKDGINIVRSIEFVNLMQRHVKDMITYIGSCVERSAGDGTTSSMIVVTKVLLEIRKYLSEVDDQKKYLNHITYTQFRSEYEAFVARVVEKMNAYAIKVTKETPKDKIAALAYHQAMTSSHGDKVLAEMVSQFFSSISPEAWKNIHYRRETHESAALYSFETKDCDFMSSRASVFSGNMLNAEQGTEYVMEGGKLVVCPTALISNSPNWPILKNLIKEAIDSKDKLTVIAGSAYDSTIQQQFEEMFHQATEGHNVAIFTLDATGNPLTQHLTALGAILGYNVANYQKLITVDNVDVKFKRRRLMLSGIATYDADCQIVGHADEKIIIGAYLKDLSAFIERRTKEKDDPYIAKELSVATELYNHVKFRNLSTFVIGGKAYDHIAANEVVHDTFTATRRSLLEGTVLGSFATLKRALSDIIKEERKEKKSLAAVLAHAFISGIQFVEMCVLKYSPTPDLNEILPLTETEPSREWIASKLEISQFLTAREMGLCVYDVMTNSFVNLEMAETKGNHVIVQPISTDIAMMNRFGEVALKFLFANRIMVPNSVVVNDDPKSKEAKK